MGIKAQRYRSLDKNLDDAISRLQQLIESAAAVPKSRKPTHPTPGSRRKRLDAKTRRGRIKAARGPIRET